MSDLFIYALFTGAVFAGGVYVGRQLLVQKYAVQIGEQIVHDVLNDSFSEPYALLSNITLPITDKDGVSGTSQIDHVFICSRGLFVIETKYFNGSIVGAADSIKWHQYTSFDKRTFQNPIRQNYSHLMAIEALSSYPHSSMFNVVAFSGNAVFKSEQPAGVVQSNELKAYIESQPTGLLSPDEIYRLTGLIQVHRLTVSESTDQVHVNYLRNKLSTGNKKGLK